MISDSNNHYVDIWYLNGSCKLYLYMKIITAVSYYNQIWFQVNHFSTLNSFTDASKNDNFEYLRTFFK